MDAVEASEIVRNYAIVIAGGVGIVVAIWRAVAADRQSKAASNQFHQARREHVTSMFFDAVAKLEDESTHVRLGAVLMLREITETYPELSRPTVDSLSNYLRTVRYSDEDPPPEVAEIMRVLIPEGDPE